MSLDSFRFARKRILKVIAEWLTKTEMDQSAYLDRSAKVKDLQLRYCALERLMPYAGDSRLMSQIQELFDRDALRLSPWGFDRIWGHLVDLLKDPADRRATGARILDLATEISRNTDAGKSENVTLELKKLSGTLMTVAHQLAAEFGNDERVSPENATSKPFGANEEVPMSASVGRFLDQERLDNQYRPASKNYY